MQNTTYFIYALLDTRYETPKPFYIATASGSRDEANLLNLENSAENPAENSRAGQIIKEIESSGCKVVAEVLIESLTENQSREIEADLKLDLTGLGV